MFNPKTIALVGASRKRGKVGNILLQNLIKSKKEIFPVNISAGKIMGLKSYRSILDIENRIDMAIIALPAGIVPKIIDQCGAKGIKDIVIISAGFSEVGDEELEKRTSKKIKMHKMNVLGPNCMGFINNVSGLNATFFEGTPKKGKMAFISQSGALGSAVLDWAIQKGIGFSYFFSIGNMMETGFSKIINFLEKDKRTDQIIIYMESLKNGRKFFDTARKAKKPIAVIKAGRSQAGSKAASSHTGALAGPDRIYSGVFKQAGIVRLDKLEDMMNIARSIQMGKKPSGKKLLVITNAGGPGVLTADFCEREGIDLARLPKKVMDKLEKSLPKNWSKNNPIDVVGDAGPKRFNQVFGAIKNKNFYDAIMVIVTPQAMTDPVGISNEIVKFSRKSKPLFTCFMGGEKIESAINNLEKNNIPNFKEPEEACRTISRLMRLF